MLTHTFPLFRDDAAAISLDAVVLNHDGALSAGAVRPVRASVASG
jgi:hypothetical protein